MGIYANGNIGTVYVGTSEISDIYVGTNLVYTKLSEEQRPFYFRVADDSTSVTVSFERATAAFHDYGSPTEPSIDYSKFSNYQAPTFQYSYDRYNWNTYTLGNTILIGNGASSNIVYFRGDNTKPWYDTYTTTTTATVDGEQKTYEHEYRVWTQARTFTDGVKCGGNIMSLRYKNFSDKQTLPCANAFRGLFYQCASILTAPVLPATSITTGCYASMFEGTSITKAPALPATTLKADCYASMFAKTKITKGPTLSATTLTNNCYGAVQEPDKKETTLKSLYGMFGDCDELTTAPTLPATTLAENCYYYMFSSCGKLTAAPSLPAKTMKPYCYSNMFNNCSGLTTAPALPATTLDEHCYHYMFSGCSALKTAPSLPATKAVESCYAYMFNNCKALTTPPSLPATTLEMNCYYYMFYGCTSLTKIPQLKALSIETGCYGYMFSDTNVRANSSSSGVCTKAYRIPTSGTGDASSKAMSSMFPNIDDSGNYSPSVNTTFYINLPSFA